MGLGLHLLLQPLLYHQLLPHLEQLLQQYLVCECIFPLYNDLACINGCIRVEPTFASTITSCLIPATGTSPEMDLAYENPSIVPSMAYT